MTHDDIIRMARVAGVRDDGHRFEFSEYKYLERFAELVELAKCKAYVEKIQELKDFITELKDYITELKERT